MHLEDTSTLKVLTHRVKNSRSILPSVHLPFNILTLIILSRIVMYHNILVLNIQEYICGNSSPLKFFSIITQRTVSTLLLNKTLNLQCFVHTIKLDFYNLQMFYCVCQHPQKLYNVCGREDIHLCTLLINIDTHKLVSLHCACLQSLVMVCL